MRHVFSVVAILVAFFSFVGCMNVSPDKAADVQKLQSFQIQNGVTTKADLIAQLGPWTTHSEGSDGTETMTWSKTHIDLDAVSMAVAIGTSDIAGHGRATGYGCALQVTLRNGVVVDFSRTENNMSTRN
jgi:hypothetical protein